METNHKLLTRNIMKNKKQIDILIAEIKKASRNPLFPHHTWFVKYHLEIVEKIALELCDKYPHADKELVLLLVWFHDYGKIVDYKNQYEATLTLGKEKLLELHFPKDIVKKIITYMKIFDGKEAIGSSPIEIQIVSSADGASHLIGPFFSLYWKEHPAMTAEELMIENRRKALIDWEQKMILPEIKKAFLSRHQQFLERCGKFPEKYLV